MRMALTRSENMSHIRGRDTSPEIELRRALWRCGSRFRINVATPGGRADIGLTSRKIAVFVDGCFWHGCPLHYVRPRTRNVFWDEKLRENVERDRRQSARLVESGWTLIRVWEHEIRQDPERVAQMLTRALRGQLRTSKWRAWRVVRVEWVDVASGLERRFLERLDRSDRSRVVERLRSTRKMGRVPGVVVDVPKKR